MSIAAAGSVRSLTDAVAGPTSWNRSCASSTPRAVSNPSITCSDALVPPSAAKRRSLVSRRRPRARCGRQRNSRSCVACTPTPRPRSCRRYSAVPPERCSRWPRRTASARVLRTLPPRMHAVSAAATTSGRHTGIPKATCRRTRGRAALATHLAAWPRRSSRRARDRRPGCQSVLKSSIATATVDVRHGMGCGRQSITGNSSTNYCGRSTAGRSRAATW